MNFAVAETFGELSLRIGGNHVTPERHRTGVARVLDDFPRAGEAVEYQSRRIAADAGSAMLLSNEELRHSMVRGLFTRSGNARPGDQGKAHGITPF